MCVSWRIWWLDDINALPTCDQKINLNDALSPRNWLEIRLIFDQLLIHILHLTALDSLSFLIDQPYSYIWASHSFSRNKFRNFIGCKLDTFKPTQTKGKFGIISVSVSWTCCFGICVFFFFLSETKTHVFLSYKKNRFFITYIFQKKVFFLKKK